MKVVCLSDTHGYHDRISVPEGDLLLFAGDMGYQSDLSAVNRFAKWLSRLPHKYKIIVAGNHDFPFDRAAGSSQTEVINARGAIRRAGAIYLEDESVVIEGLTIYGSPWQPWHGGWAFNFKQDGSDSNACWEKIPTNTDVLVTHCPPAGILDSLSQAGHIGDPNLAIKLGELENLKLHVFGHIHDSYGEIDTRPYGPVFANVAIAGMNYRPANEPKVFVI